MFYFSYSWVLINICWHAYMQLHSHHPLDWTLTDLFWLIFCWLQETAPKCCHTYLLSSCYMCSPAAVTARLHDRSSNISYLSSMLNNNIMKKKFCHLFMYFTETGVCFAFLTMTKYIITCLNDTLKWQIKLLIWINEFMCLMNDFLKWTRHIYSLEVRGSDLLIQAGTI